MGRSGDDHGGCDQGRQGESTGVYNLSNAGREKYRRFLAKGKIIKFSKNHVKIWIILTFLPNFKVQRLKKWFKDVMI